MASSSNFIELELELNYSEAIVPEVTEEKNRMANEQREVTWDAELKRLVDSAPNGNIIRALTPRPNLEMPVWNKKIAWTVLGTYQDWEVQQNKLTKHCRVLSPKGERVAWGRTEKELRFSLKLTA